MNDVRLIPLSACPTSLYDIAMKMIRINDYATFTINGVRTRIISDQDYYTMKRKTK